MGSWQDYCDNSSNVNMARTEVVSEKISYGTVGQGFLLDRTSLWPHFFESISFRVSIEPYFRYLTVSDLRMFPFFYLALS